MGSPWVSADYQLLQELQQQVVQTATGTATEHERWMAEVNALLELWPDGAGVDFHQLNGLALRVAEANADFLGELGRALAQAIGIYQDAGTYAKAVVGGGR